MLLLVVLVPLLIVGLVAYTKLRGLWYKITGRPQPDSFKGFSGGFNTHTQQQETKQNGGTKKTKTGGADEGEYVDFEVVD